jgi:hypothetical protein
MLLMTDIMVVQYIVTGAQSGSPTSGESGVTTTLYPGMHPGAAPAISWPHGVAMQVEGDSLLIGRHVQHSAFSLADKLFQPIRRGEGGG